MMCQSRWISEANWLTFFDKQNDQRSSGRQDMREETKDIITSQDRFVGEIRTIIDKARATAVRSVDFCRVQMYWNIGKRIFEEEQHGKERAEYGAYLIKNLAKELEPEYGSGFGERQLKFCRQFYRTYPIGNTPRSQLNWSQYRMLIQIPDPDKREYYELESINNAWTARETERQNYYDRCEKQEDENPTIGILLCTDKNDTVVKMALPEGNTTIMASKYQLYLPTTEQLIKEIDEVRQSAQKEKETEETDDVPESLDW